jgi:hypothetical protein
MTKIASIDWEILRTPGVFHCRALAGGAWVTS